MCIFLKEREEREERKERKEREERRKREGREKKERGGRERRKRRILKEKMNIYIETYIGICKDVWMYVGVYESLFKHMYIIPFRKQLIFSKAQIV